MLPKLILVAALYLLPLSRAHHNLRASPVPRWARNRVFALSRSGPMAAYFSGNATARRDLLALLEHMREQEKRMRELRERAEDSPDGAGDLCNRVPDEPLESARAKTKTLGFGAFQSDCITAVPIPFSEELFRRMVSFGAAVQRAGVAAARATRIGWRDAYGHARFEHSARLQVCSVVHAVGYRVRGRWAVLSSVTEFPTNLFKADPGRRYITELLTAPANSSDAVGNMRMSLPACDSQREGRSARDQVCDTSFEGSRPTVSDATTTLEDWRGIPAASIFRQVMPLDENPAVRRALAKGRAWRQSAFDATTASNIAIMLLGASLAFIPIALFADVSGFVALCYTLFTDFLAGMPLAAKGIDLINDSRRKANGAVVWVYGMESDTDTAIVETWLATCESYNRLRVTGAVFTAVALTCIVTGVTLEIVARRHLLKCKRRYFMEMELMAEQEGKQMWRNSEGCVECSCHLRRRGSWTGGLLQHKLRSLRE